MMKFELETTSVAVVGLGYVGLPLAVAIAEAFPVMGFDIDASRIEDLKQHRDKTGELDPAELVSSACQFSSRQADLAGANLYIITVPTPITKYKQPDLQPLVSASEIVGSVLSEGDVVVYESTVYPGVTEEVCVPILARVSGLEFNVSFFAGYSPERINPGDDSRRVTDIVKVTSGSTPEVASYLSEFYGRFVSAGIHQCPTIQVAEAAKVIENTQRDLNIALVNELAIIFDRMGIDTDSVLDAASTKWNFNRFSPGLVGGHCIGVDPYYLTHRAQHYGYHPEVILAGRRINDGMGAFVTTRVVKLMISRDIRVHKARVLVLGLAFKENCPDLRNTRVIDVVRELESYDIDVAVYDPRVDPEEAQSVYGLKLAQELIEDTYDAIVLAVPHKEFADMGVQEIRRLGRTPSVLFEVKPLFGLEHVDGRL